MKPESHPPLPQSLGDYMNQVSVPSRPPSQSTSAWSVKPIRLAYFVSHPFQYQAPLLGRIAQESDIDLTLFFSSDFRGLLYHDSGFGVELEWDVPLLDGYKYVFLTGLRDTNERPISNTAFRRN